MNIPIEKKFIHGPDKISPKINIIVRLQFALLEFRINNAFLDHKFDEYAFYIGPEDYFEFEK